MIDELIFLVPELYTHLFKVKECVIAFPIEYSPTNTPLQVTRKPVRAEILAIDRPFSDINQTPAVLTAES
jgi:hypothetical protein